MKTAGMVFIVLAAGSVGFRISISLKERSMLFRKLLHILHLMKNEIAYYGTPLPQVFALMAASADGVLEEIFSSAAREMERQHWTTPRNAMEKALRQVHDTALEAILLSLCDKLGKYDLDAQMTGIHTAEAETEAVLTSLEQERSGKSRTYRTLGICAGLATSVLLM